MGAVAKYMHESPEIYGFYAGGSVMGKPATGGAGSARAGSAEIKGVAGISAPGDSTMDRARARARARARDTDRDRGTGDHDGNAVVSMTLTSAGGSLEVSFEGNAATLAGPVSKVADTYIDSGRLASKSFQVVSRS